MAFTQARTAFGDQIIAIEQVQLREQPQQMILGNIEERRIVRVGATGTVEVDECSGQRDTGHVTPFQGRVEAER